MHASHVVVVSRLLVCCHTLSHMCDLYYNVISFSVSIVSSLLCSSLRTCSSRGVQIVPTSCIRDNSSSWKRSNWVMIWSDHKAQIWRRSQLSSPVLPLNMCLYPHPGFFFAIITTYTICPLLSSRKKALCAEAQHATRALPPTPPWQLTTAHKRWWFYWRRKLILMRKWN